jgi:hypothetical protein
LILIATGNLAFAGGVRWNVFGLDVSGSYRLLDKASNGAADLLLREAAPGDVWWFRVIKDQSYDESAAIMTLRMPQAAPHSANVFDRRSRQQELSSERTIDQARRAAADYLRGFRMRRSDKTDILGFLAKAGELLEAAPPGADKNIYIASDMKDNAGQNPQIKLRNVSVFVWMFQSGADARDAQNRRKMWEDRLKRWGAKSVTFIDPSQISVGGTIKGEVN